MNAEAAMDFPPVSVVMPAFNHERYVRQALDSVLNTGLPHVELLVADDASTDGTADIIRAWGQECGDRLARFVFIDRKRNVGLCASLTELITAARGELIHIIASDDYYLPGGLETKTRTMLEHPEWTAAFCDASAIGPNDESYAPSLLDASSRMSRDRLTPEFITEELLYHWDVIPSFQTWRRNAFKAHGGSFEHDSTVFCEDFDGVWWTLANGTMGFIPHVCQAYRCRSWPQTSDRNRVREFRDIAYVLEKNARYFSPSIAAAMRNYAAVFSSAAIGDHGLSGEHSKIHALNTAAFVERAARGDKSGGNPPVGLGTGVDPAEDYKEKLSAVTAALAEAKSQIKVMRTAAQAEAAAAKELRHQLRYHSANPKRALELWWRKNKS